MNKQVWKYELNDIGESTIHTPKGSEVLTAQIQNGSLFIWLLVDPSAMKELRFFEVFGTGHDMRYDMGVERKYISTFQLHGGSIVLHVFERL
jgi:hypothetical protein